MDFTELTLVTSQEAKEAAAGILYHMGAAGLVVADEEPPTLDADVEDWGTPLPVAFTDEVRLTAYFPSDLDVAHLRDEALARLTALVDYGLNPLPCRVETGTVHDSDWENSWKQYYHPLRIGKRLLIQPVWEKAEPRDQDVVVTLDPGPAFGTGTHPTTAMALEALEAYVPSVENAVVWDIGTGSGILAIAAARLGAAQVLAVDNDPLAVHVTGENAALNKPYDSKIEIRQGSLLEGLSGQCDIMVANIIARIVLELVPDAAAHVRPGGLLFVGGIIAERAAEVQAALAAHGFYIVEEHAAGEWRFYVTRRKTTVA